MNKTKIIQILHVNGKILEYSNRPKHNMPRTTKKNWLYSMKTNQTASALIETKKSYSFMNIIEWNQKKIF